MFDAILAQLKVELEYLPLDSLEWKVLADLYEEHGDNVMATGLRSCIEGGYEPVYLNDSRAQITEAFLRSWHRKSGCGEEEPFSNNCWLWQTQPLWRNDDNYVVSVVFHVLKGKPYDKWKLYPLRVEAIFDLVHSATTVYGTGGWPKRLKA